jgi:RND family efflux transporter MFP subunit
MKFLFRKFSFYLGIAGLAGAVVMAMRMSASEPMPPPPVKPPVKPFDSAIAASGIVEATRENTQIGAPAPGLVMAVDVEVSDRVEKGAPLFHLDDRELAATLSVQRANVAVAEATMKRLGDQLARLRGVGTKGVVSQEEIQTRENDVTVAAAQIDLARAQAKQTEALIGRLVVCAPIDGTVLQVNIRPGELVPAAPKNPPMVLGNIAQLQVRADVDEQLASRVRPGSKAIGYIRGAPETAIPMRFVRIEPFVIPKTSLTGAAVERVDTRVLQVIYSFDQSPEIPIYVGQQIDLFIED